MLQVCDTAGAVYGAIRIEIDIELEVFELAGGKDGVAIPKTPGISIEGVKPGELLVGSRAIKIGHNLHRA